MANHVRINNHPTGKRYVISDIHGCFKTFRSLVEEVLRFEKSDHIYLLGDYVDRGPSSRAVLDYIFKLIEDGFNVYPLRGNHENDLIEYAKGEPRFLLWHLNKHKYPDIVEDGKVIQKYLSFFISLPFYYELDKYLLVHAGFDFKSVKPFENMEAMLWQRYFDPPAEELNGKTVIHGHDPVYLDVIEKRIAIGAPSIPLDNGACYVGKHKIYNTSKLGKLCAFDLDSRKLYTQQNLDMI